jgi:hypothetical protein
LGLYFSAIRRRIWQKVRFLEGVFYRLSGLCLTQKYLAPPQFFTAIRPTHRWLFSNFRPFLIEIMILFSINQHILFENIEQYICQYIKPTWCSLR